MRRHEPCVVWPMRRIGVYPQWIVRTSDESTLEVQFFPDAGDGLGFKISRSDARMLARRLNQCLDDTMKGRKQPATDKVLCDIGGKE